MVNGFCKVVVRVGFFCFRSDCYFVVIVNFMYYIFENVENKLEIVF